MGYLKWITGAFFGLVVPIGIILVIGYFYFRSARRYLHVDKNTKLDPASVVPIKKGEKWGEAKKRYLYCERCGKYTRFVVINQGLPDNPLLVTSSLLIAAKDLLVRTKLSPQRVCHHCGNRQNLKEVFLQTIVERGGKEIAYFTPSGERIELKSEDTTAT